MAAIVGEFKFDTPLTEEEENRIARRLDQCLEAHNSHWVRSYISSDHRREICQFDAPDVEAVRTACREAEISFEEIWEAEVYAQDEQPTSVAGVE